MKTRARLVAMLATLVAATLAAAPAQARVRTSWRRLLDVAPSGSETLVARGLYRPDVTTSATRQLFQLHPGGWHFASGHTAKLELLTSDSPYARPSNGQSPVLVSNLQLRLPVHEQPGSNSQVVAPAAKIVPAGYTLARDWR